MELCLFFFLSLLVFGRFFLFISSQDCRERQNKGRQTLACHVTAVSCGQVSNCRHEAMGQLFSNHVRVDLGALLYDGHDDPHKAFVSVQI